MMLGTILAVLTAVQEVCSRGWIMSGAIPLAPSVTC